MILKIISKRVQICSVSDLITITYIDENLNRSKGKSLFRDVDQKDFRSRITTWAQMRLLINEILTCCSRLVTQQPNWRVSDIFFMKEHDKWIDVIQCIWQWHYSTCIQILFHTVCVSQGCVWVSVNESDIMILVYAPSSLPIYSQYWMWDWF